MYLVSSWRIYLFVPWFKLLFLSRGPCQVPSSLTAAIDSLGLARGTMHRILYLFRYSAQKNKNGIFRMFYLMSSPHGSASGYSLSSATAQIRCQASNSAWNAI